jgi:hypothetical protein
MKRRDAGRARWNHCTRFALRGGLSNVKEKSDDGYAERHAQEVTQ